MKNQKKSYDTYLYTNRANTTENAGKMFDSKY